MERAASSPPPLRGFNPHCAPAHTNPKRKRGSYADLPRLRFGLVSGALSHGCGGRCAMRVKRSWGILPAGWHPRLNSIRPCRGGKTQENVQCRWQTRSKASADVATTLLRIPIPI
jgi:hypothetical protein